MTSNRLLIAEDYELLREGLRATFARTAIEIVGEATTGTQAPPRTTSQALCNGSVEEAVRRQFAGCSYNFVFDKLSWQFANGTLTLQGCVPSFYLKQVLQELQLSIGQVDRIENDVAVVGSTGLSSDTLRKTR